MGTIPGAVLGASILFVLPEKLREFADYRLLLFGLGLIVLMRLRPQGLIADRHRRAELVGEPEPHARGRGRAGGEGGGARHDQPGVGGRRGVSMQFGGLRALNDVSFALTEGEIIGLIGPNGAGKTTLFNCLTGQYTPTSGTVSRSGEPLPAGPGAGHRAGRRAHVPEHPAVPEHDRRGERAGRAARADEAEPVLVAAARAGLSSAARPRRPGAPRSCWSSSGSPVSPTSWPATCPTATSGGWRSPARWPPNRRCSCSTSPPRA